MPEQLFSRRALREIAVLAEDFIVIAFRLFRKGKILESRTRTTQMMISWVGATPTMLGMLWYLLESTQSEWKRGASKERLLWGLLLLKAYESEKKNAAVVGGVDEATFAKWSWYFLSEISFLESFVIDSELHDAFFCVYLKNIFFFVAWVSVVVCDPVLLRQVRESHNI